MLKIKNNICLLLALLLALAPLQGQAVDLSSPDYSETDASNTTASPNGWPAGTYFNQVEPIGRATLGFMKRFWNRINSTVVTTGSAGAYVYTPINTSYPATYITGETYSFIANFASVGNDTLNVNSLGAEPMYKAASAGVVKLAANDIPLGAHIVAQYDASLNSSAGGFYVVGGLYPGQNSQYFTGGGSTGSANAQVVTTVNGNATKTQGNFVTFIAAYTNTGAMTLNIDGSGVTAVDRLYKNGIVSGLSGREVQQNWPVTVVFFNGVWSLINPMLGLDGANFTTDSSSNLIFGTAPTLPATSTLANGVVATTQAANDISTKIATTAFANPASAIQGTGSVKLPSGLIINWGNVNPSGTSGTVSFRTSYANTLFAVVASDDTFSSAQSHVGVTATIGGAATGFTYHCSSAATSISWMAIGN